VFSERLQTGSPKVFRDHRDPELHFGVKAEEERLGQPGDIGRIVHLHNRGGATLPVVLAEVDRFRFDGIQNLVDSRPDTAVFDEVLNGSIGN
jgi:hypothetical protein